MLDVAAGFVITSITWNILYELISQVATIAIPGASSTLIIKKSCSPKTVPATMRKAPPPEKNLIKKFL
jgi:hypothetical protein